MYDIGMAESPSIEKEKVSWSGKWRFVGNIPLIKTEFKVYINLYRHVLNFKSPRTSYIVQIMFFLLIL